MNSSHRTPIGSRRTISNSYEVLDLPSQSASTTRKRKKKPGRSTTQDEPQPKPAFRNTSAEAAKIEEAASSPKGPSLDDPLTAEERRIARSFTDLTQARSTTPPQSPTRGKTSAKNLFPATPPANGVGSPPGSSLTAGTSLTHTRAASSSPQRRQAHAEAAEPTGERPKTLWAYVNADLNPKASMPSVDAFWGQTERQRVYNALIYVPYQLERLVNFGMLICFDSFLAIFTVVPVRFVRACLHTCWPRFGPPRSPGLQAQQLFDAICVFIFASAVLFLWVVNAGALYFWMKDLTQEFLKLHVIATAVEILDKIACSFVIDSMEALSGTCATLVSSSSRRQHILAVCMDTGVLWVLVLGHALVLMCQGMAFSVAMNSKRAPALVALVIASNFAEVKGTVFKRFDATKLFALTCQDVVERFHLVLALSFVLAEEMVSAGRVWPNAHLLWQSAYILGAEVAIDVLKHAVLGRFNEIRPGVYREFTFDVSERVQHSQSHNIHRVVSFEPLAPAALFLRILLTFIGGQRAATGPFQESKCL
ncbi:hypothetical protein WJX73_001775 [Symbiochloris irregularis]|uniref:Uncharacterized protein n=1 Tax=Symbiochloris irregularis TaxID=706552 RepID=A0AAW1PVA0_9CHLO